MWFIPLLLATMATPMQGVVVGAGVGIVHGAARAVGVLANLYDPDACALPWKMMLICMRWRLADGIGLLLAVAALGTLHL